MHHPRYCLVHNRYFFQYHQCYHIKQLTHAGTPTRHLRCHVTYASMSTTPPRLARHPPQHATHSTHASTPPMPPTLARHPRKDTTHPIHVSTYSTPFLKLHFIQNLNQNLLRVDCKYVSWLLLFLKVLICNLYCIFLNPSYTKNNEGGKHFSDLY